MKRAIIKELTETYDSLRLSPIHPVRDEERKLLDREYADQAITQWDRTAEAPKF